MPPESSPRSPRRRRFWRALLRESAHHLGALAIYVANVALFALALLLTYVLIRGDLPLPDFVRAQIERELAARGLEVKFETAALDPAGRVVVRGLELAPARFDEPLFAAAHAVVELNRLKLLGRQPELVAMHAEGVRLICPAAISPTGRPEALIEISSLRLHRDDEHWMIDGAVANVGELRLTARGIFTAAPSRRPTPTFDLETILRRFGELAPRVVRAKAALASVTAPQIDLTFTGATGRATTINAHFTAEKWRDARIGEAAELELRTTATIGGGEPAPLQITGRARRVALRGDLAIDDLSFRADWPALPSAPSPWPARVDLAAPAVAHPKLTVHNVALTAAPGAFPHIAARAAFMVEDETVALELAGDARARRGDVAIRGRFGRTWLAKASEVRGSDLTYYARIAEPPDFSARVEIDDGGQWRQAEFRALSGPIVARRVALDRARIHGIATPAGVTIDHLELQRGDEHGLGTYADEFATRENRLRLRGAMRPRSIAAWFGPWWDKFWSDFDFTSPPPEFAVDVHGDWNNGERTIVRGSADVGALTLKGVPASAATLQYFIRPNYFDIYDATLVRPEGHVIGEFQLLNRPKQREPYRQTFDFSSTADLVDLARIFGAGGEALLAPYRYQAPPLAAVKGSVTNDAGVYDVDLAVRIDATQEFRFHDFPLEALHTDVRIRNKLVELPAIDATYAGGAVRGHATADNGRLTFDASLTGADYDRAVAVFTEFLSRKSPQPDAEAKSESAGLAARKVGGLLDLTLAAAGPTTQFNAYEGRGTAHIKQAELGRISLFGLLTDLLRTVGLSVGNLNFRDAASNFELRRDRIHFPDLRVTGDTAALQTAGTYLLADGSVDFRARLFPLRESSGAVTQLFGLILDPFSNLLEVNLTGTLKQPRWNFTYGPTAILRALSGQSNPDAVPSGQPVETTPASGTTAPPPAATPPSPPPAGPK